MLFAIMSAAVLKLARFPGENFFQLSAELYSLQVFAPPGPSLKLSRHFENLPQTLLACFWSALGLWVVESRLPGAKVYLRL